MKSRTLALPLGTLLLLPLAAAPDAKPTPTPRPTRAPVLSLHGTPAPAAPSSGSASLADTVRRAKASATPAPKKRSLGVISNETLKKPEGNGKGSVQVGPARPIGNLPPESAAPAAGPNESEWRTRAIQARQRVDSADAEVKRLENETKRLENDFYAWSDGNYRDRVIKPAWDQAKDDLKKARAEYDTAQAAMADLEEDARKAGVPPGWLRESQR